MNDLISRKALLAEYDREHIGEPGKARKLIEDAPGVTDTNDGRKIEKLQKKVTALEKSNRNWRRKYQRLKTERKADVERKDNERKAD